MAHDFYAKVDTHKSENKVHLTSRAAFGLLSD